MEIIATKEILKEVAEAANKDDVYIKGSAETPEIVLNSSEGEIKFAGRSMPEDAKAFYQPLKEWIQKYAESPAPGTRVVFGYEYFNTSSSKMIMELIEEVKKIQEKDNQLRLEWHYLEDDDDMLEAGEDYEDILDVNFEFVSFE